MKIILFVFLVLNILIGQNSVKPKLDLNNRFGISGGAFANFGNSGLELDGIISLHTKKGFFFEASGILSIDNNFTLNNSMGYMLEISPNLFIGGGYSNYLEKNLSSLNEILFTFESNNLSASSFFGLDGSLSPNFLCSFNINSLFPNFSYDCSIIGFTSKEENSLGFDFYLNFFKKLDNGLSFGYVLSSERYEDERKLSVVKEGQTYNYTRTFIEQGVFNTIFLGITF
ncbi:MAG: hypothetical protein CMG60_00690 [Candidatus Marinimicrobia bacterium]|nr:hypothetical protein [Candidatus Neomarinimicrobiota bacterium]|tara:strand:+ start:963 stop:1646 length:684 start_codon:yes stop_codon:yes gene_type:complete